MNKIIFILLFLPSLVSAADYYIAASGGSDSYTTTQAQSESTPWATFEHAYTVLTAGDTLILLDGTYDQQLNPEISGSESGGYITFKAQNDFKAIIAPSSDPGGAALLVTSWYGEALGVVSYLAFEGLIVRGIGEHSAIRINTLDDNAAENEMTHHITMKKIGAFGDANLYNFAAFSIGNGLRDSLFEDIFSYGFGRKALQAHGAYRVTIRRAVVRYDYWDGASDKPNDPRTTFSGYNSVDCIFENFIVINTAETPSHRTSDRAALAISGNPTPSAMDSSLRTEYLGSIVLDNVGVGLTSDSGGDANDDITVKDLILYDNSSQGVNISGNSTDFSMTYITVGSGDRTGIRLNPGDTSITGMTIANNYAVDNTWYGIDYDAGQVTSVADNTLVDNAFDGSDTEASYAPDNSVRFLQPTMVSGHERGATVFYRYEDGEITTTKLWPWPNEAVIKDCMCNQTDLEAVHRWDNTDALYVGKPAWCDTSKTLTEYVWEYNGATIPSDIYGNGSATFGNATFESITWE